MKRSVQNAVAFATKNVDENQTEFVATLRSDLEKEGVDDLMQSIESIYDKYLTVEEVGDLLKHYESSGQSHGKKMAKIVEEINRIAVDWGRRLAITAMSKRMGIVDAAMAENVELIGQLLTRGVDVNSRSPEGMTALIVTARTGNIQIARLLLEKGADPNLKTKTGETALMATVSGENDELIELLLSKGSDPNAKDDRGINAYQAAELMGKKRAAAILRNKTADTNPVRVTMVVGKLGRSKGCLPVLNFPGASSKKLQCLKVGQEVVPIGVQTTEGWELISQPVMGWVAPKTLKPMFKVTGVGSSEEREASHGNGKATLNP
ncbi:MAG: ankyrin repeat domain-containing protein [Pseudomonadota bacterium]